MKFSGNPARHLPCIRSRIKSLPIVIYKMPKFKSIALDLSLGGKNSHDNWRDVLLIYREEHMICRKSQSQRGNTSLHNKRVKWRQGLTMCWEKKVIQKFRSVLLESDYDWHFYNQARKNERKSAQWAKWYYTGKFKF